MRRSDQWKGIEYRTAKLESVSLCVSQGCLGARVSRVILGAYIIALLASFLFLLNKWI